MNLSFGRSMATATFALIALALATSAQARPCLAKTDAIKIAKAGDPIHYRAVHNTQCWYVGEGADKSEFEPPARRAKTYSPEERIRWLCGDFCPSEFKQRWPR